MITIKKPKIEIENDKAIVRCEVLIGNNKKEIFYEIDKKYKDYLCIERSDAFVIGALYYAMKHHHDITCDVPLTSSIYHNLTTYLIPTLAKNSNNLSIIKLNIPTISKSIETKGKVGTGLSCGIDSMHVLKNYLNPKDKNFKLDYLCLNNVGSFKAYQERYRGIGEDKARDMLTERAIEVAKEVNLPLIITNSNIHAVFSDTYSRVHTFANMFSVFLLQKLFSKYFYASSGLDSAHYSVVDTKELDSAEYEILIFYCLNTPTIKIYSEGMEKNRIEKTIDIADFKLAQKYLHVCIKDGINCNRCMKCKRTILSLEAIGKLDDFKNVFDLNYFKTHKNEYYEWLDNEADNKSLMNLPTYNLIKQKNKKTSYQDISEYNKNNIIVPENDIDSISIIKDKTILNKNSDVKYKNSLYYKLLVCIKIANRKNKEIEINKKILKNIKFNLKNSKKYLRNLLSKKTVKINLHDLIYFILYKPETSMKVIKFLAKNNYLDDLKYNKNKYFTSHDLAEAFKDFISNEFLKEALSVSKININKYLIKNNNIFLNKKDIYYKNEQYTKTFIDIEENKSKYYFLGVSNDYIICLISSYTGKKNSIYEDSTIGYRLVKLLLDKDKK